MQIRAYNEADLPAMIAIWNEVVEEGVAFPQEEALDAVKGAAFFASQTYCGVAEAEGKVAGLYILHPNNVLTVWPYLQCQLRRKLCLPRPPHR